MKEKRRKQTEKVMLSVVIDPISGHPRSQVLCPRTTDSTRDLQLGVGDSLLSQGKPQEWASELRAEAPKAMALQGMTLHRTFRSRRPLPFAGPGPLTQKCFAHYMKPR